MSLEETCLEMRKQRIDAFSESEEFTGFYEKFVRKSDGSELNQNTIYCVKIVTAGVPTEEVDVIVDYYDGSQYDGDGNFIGEKVIQEFVYTTENYEKTAKKEKKFLAKQMLLED